jgi:hypothetical protein
VGLNDCQDERVYPKLLMDVIIQKDIISRLMRVLLREMILQSLTQAM